MWIRFGERTWTLDMTAPISVLDLDALDEMGLSLDGYGELLGRLSVVGRGSSIDAMSEAVRLAAKLAYLAAARGDHRLRWRTFAHSITQDDFRTFAYGDGDAPAPTAGTAEPRTPGTPEEPAASLGDALVAAGATAPAEETTQKPKRVRASRAKKPPAG